MSIVNFLLVYDRDQQKLIFQRPYENPQEAVKAYEQMEERHREDRRMEIVLVGADSLETIMLTHGNYFDAVPLASPYLSEV